MTAADEHLSIGPQSRARQVGGAAVLAAGSVVMFLTTWAGFKLYQNVAVLGAIITLAWLVDGTSRRYVGAGLASLAIGVGLTIGQDVGVKNYEHSLVYALLGVALLAVSWISPKAARGSGAFLLVVAATVAVLTWGPSYNGGWEIAAGLAAWALLEFGRIARTQPQAAPESSRPAPAMAGSNGRAPAPDRSTQLTGRR